MAKSWKQIQINYMETFYKQYADKWADKKDDRGVFCNIYHMIMKAIESLPDEPNNYVCCAMNHEIGKDRATLEEIKLFFNGDIPRDGYWFKEHD